MMTFVREKMRRWGKYKEDLKDRNLWSYHLVDTLEALAFAVVVALLIRTYVLQTSMVPSASMEPTLMVNDRLFVNKFIYRFTKPSRGDIVVFSSPFNDGKDYVKRCIALPGETVEVRKGVVLINGRELVLTGVNFNQDESDFLMVKVPDHAYFVMGDNRGNSNDSRFWGFVPEESLLGKALFTFWPFSRMRALR